MKKAAVALALLLASLALVACGGSDDDGSDTTSQSGTAQETEANEGAAGGGGEDAKDEAGGKALSFEADPSGSLAYTTDNVTWGPGEVTIAFNNPASVPHNVAIENEAGETIAKTEVITESSENTTAELKPGKKYTFYCSVPGHREAGMEGTLTVK